MWRDFFYFSSADRLAIMLLSALLLVGLCCLWLLSGREPDGVMAGEVDTVAVVTLPQIPSEERRLELRPFDPNKADSLTLAEMGIPHRVVRNLLRYRKAGGVFRTRESVVRIYGFNDSLFTLLAPYIIIDPIYQPKVPAFVKSKVGRDSLRQAHRPASRRDTVLRRSYPLVEKYPVGTVLDLNAADTAELKKIPGIGSYFSRRIVSYRQQLGGFSDVNQLAEIEGLPDSLFRWFRVSSPPFRKIAVNRSSVEVLRRHPYINFYQARIIVEHRKQRGPLGSLQQLSLYDEFTAADIDRLRPYLSFE